jgi:hypothetical protein
MGKPVVRRLRLGKGAGPYRAFGAWSPDWPRFKEAVLAAVRAEANAYRDCTPIMACVLAAESPDCPPAAVALDSDQRVAATCRALNQLAADGRVALVDVKDHRTGRRLATYRPAC